MNPDRNRDGMTVHALLQIGLLSTSAFIVVIFVALFFVVLRIDRNIAPLVVVGGGIVVLLGAIISHYLMQRRIRDRIQGLLEVCRDFAAGDRMVRAVVNGDDDFAVLSMSINTLLDNQANMSGGSLGTGNDAAALQAQIEKLLQEVSAVGDGDLRVQAEVTPDTLGVLADSFNYMIEELAKVVGRVQSTAVQVTNATRRILDRSAELALASEAQVAQISQTTEAVEALATFIQNVARNAQLSAEAAQEALRNADSGQQAVRQTIDGMMLIRENVQETAKKIKRLGERSNEIGEIVRIIEDIADQTNLLALNAAIQSAMAGEHGRGFAVVADEIRLLAERSTDSTKKIATLVKSIQGDTYEAVVAMEDSTQEVVKGSQLADEAGRALNSIYTAVARQAQMIESIARAANDQTSVSEAVAVAMSRISELTRQTDAGTQEAAVSVSYLAELSEQLRASVSTFRLPERNNEMLGSFSSVPSIAEMPNGSANPAFAASMSSAAMDGDWSQNFSANFPPLPEPGNSGSLVSMNSRSGNMGQFAFNNQQDFGNQAGFNNQFSNLPPLGNPPFPGQGNFGDQGAFNGRSFDSQGSFPNQQGFSPQPGFGGSPFGNQQGFDLDGFDGRQGFSGGQQPFYSGNGFGAPNQSSFPQGSGNVGSPSNPGLLPPPQGNQPGPSRPRWQQPGNAQGQFSFNQDQLPFQNNG